MKKTININLGQQPFTIDEDAYDVLRDYLSRLESLFSSDPSIVTDIEYRFAEILHEKTQKSAIINLNHIEEGIAQIGTVESISDEPESASHEHSLDQKLYRDLDNVLVSGVSSGIAHYLGIKQPIFVRLFFALTIFTPFTFIYILLWATLPKRYLGNVPVGKSRLRSIFRDMISEITTALESLNRKFNGSTSNS